MTKCVTKHQIVVLHCGFVFMGDVERTEKEVIIHNANNIRKWGTERGLGQIAADGPTEKTILDYAGTVRFHPLAEVCSYDCTYGE